MYIGSRPAEWLVDWMGVFSVEDYTFYADRRSIWRKYLYIKRQRLDGRRFPRITLDFHNSRLFMRKGHLAFFVEA